mgnify:CR=1 FL=1
MMQTARCLPLLKFKPGRRPAKLLSATKPKELGKYHLFRLLNLYNRLEFQLLLCLLGLNAVQSRH